ncbi:uncharacterized protein LOC131656556 [Vicia villosa]|uniref:uncharacterized protein LOC131656556 n=1 Tax=Vicia villosa TaxID=3911 RepID=UPI00273C8CE6|nr:uncharacterized protein LOC131656556 [Vicia villosa]
MRQKRQSNDESLVSDSATPEESSNPNRVLKVVPLRTISNDEVRATKPKTTHAKRPKEGIHNKGTKSSASATMEKLTKEGSKYVDSAITRIVNRILKENHQVHGITIPLQTVMADPPQQHHQQANNKKKGKAVVKGSPKRITQVNNPAKDAIRKKSTSAGPVKSKAVTKSKGVGPSNSWSRVIPKKRKEREIVEPESDVEVSVPDIPSRKKPTTSKLSASIPDVPIDNVSFHYASSVSRWKYVLQKRLAVEKELALNALENK